MDDLYGERCGVCGGFHNGPEQDIGFSREVLSQMLREIYDGLDVRDDIQRGAFEETLRLFNEATVQGLSDAGYPAGDELFYGQLRTNNEVFSAFRTHRMQNDLAARLVGRDGKLKPFEQWVKDVRNITDHYVVRWLRTEYDTAVLRAHQAADWKRFGAEADVLPNLRWMPTTSPDPDMAHRQYWEAGLTLPVDHPFWTRHRPGDRWNCKCSLMQTDEPPTEGAVADFRPVEPVPGLDGNPADGGKLFSGSHPYYTQAHPGAEKAVANLLRKRLSEWSRQNLPVVKVGKMEMRRFEVPTPGSGMVTVINRNFYEEVASKYKDAPDYAERLAFARRAHELFPESVFVRDERPEHHKDAYTFKVYEYRKGGVALEFKCKVNPDGSFLHFMRML